MTKQMGFGWLFLGYVVSYLLSSVGGMLNMKGLVCLLGYVMMLRGLWELQRYDRTFRLPLIVGTVLVPITVYEVIEEWSVTFAWNLPFVNALVTEIVVDMVDIAVMLAFHMLLYRAIASIAKRVELPRVTRDAVFDTVVGTGFAVLYILSMLPVFPTLAEQLAVPLTVYLLFWRICDLCLLVSCCKNICPAGDEDVAPRRYRWAFLNKMSDTFAQNFQRAADSTKEAREETLRRRQQRRSNRKR